MSTEAQDLSLALQGSRAALERLVQTLTPVIQVRVARVLLRRGYRSAGRDIRQEVADFSQEVFVSLFEQDCRTLKAWDSTRGLSLKGFAGLVAERQVISILRTGKRSPWTEDPTNQEDLNLRESRPDPEHQAASREELSEVLDRITLQTSPLGRRLFDLLFVDQLEVSEVCSRMDMTPDAVYAWKSRLTRLAREIYADLMSDQPASPRNHKRVEAS